MPFQDDFDTLLSLLEISPLPTRRRYYVGLAASTHDPAAAILDPEGRPLFAEGSERHLQNKRAYHCPADDLIRLPGLIQELCPGEAEIIAAVSWSSTMLQKLELATSWATALTPHSISPHFEDFNWPLPGSDLLVRGFHNALSQAGLNLKECRRLANPVSIRRYNHHLTHAALAAYTSPFKECAVAVVDGYGEDRSTSFYHYADCKLEPVTGQRVDSPAEMRQLVSLGHFYARLCAACGFDPILGEEWKVMGLAAYGKPDEEICAILKSMLRVQGLGLAAALADDDLQKQLTRLRRLGRKPGQPALEVANLAASGQQVFEDWMTELLLQLHQASPSDNLALCGGCALNSSYNGRILDRTPFRQLHVPSAPADDGCSLGAALLAYRQDHPESSLPQSVSSPYLGSTMTAESLKGYGGFNLERPAERELIEKASLLISQGKIVGWVQGAAEFGPRALGHRSILADPRRNGMKDRLNAEIKFREPFRPFAPSILDEYGADYFENYQTSRYMERTLRFRPEKVDLIPAVVHVNGTGRVQSVRREWTPRFYDLIASFYRKTGVPILLNTSLNVMGKPIVHSLEDALGVFQTTGLDALVIGDLLLSKDRSCNVDHGPPGQEGDGVDSP